MPAHPTSSSRGAHWLDAVVLAGEPRVSLFGDGWGDLDLLAELGRLAEATIAPAPIAIDWDRTWSLGDVRARRGRFRSPAAWMLPPSRPDGVLWEITPRHAPSTGAACLLFAATGEAGPGARLPIALRLARRGARTLLLETPWCGARRPAEQRGAALRRASDLCAQVAATIVEGIGLASALGEEHPAVAVAGVSMGGLVACNVAARSRRPLAVAALLTPHSGRPVYLDGPFSRRVAWSTLAATCTSHDAARRRFGELVLDPGDVTRIGPPPRTDRVVLVGARGDGFVPCSSVSALHAHWPGAELRWTGGGHVTGWALGGRVATAAIVDALARAGASPAEGGAREVP